MVINVEQKHIDTGVPMNCFCCPVASAIVDVMPEHTHVFATKKYIEIGNFIYDTPKEVSIFMTRFDNYKVNSAYSSLPGPFSFKLGEPYSS